MKPKEPVESGQHDMFRSRLDQIIHMGHEKVVLAGAIDWQFLCDKCGESYSEAGTPCIGDAASSRRRSACLAGNGWQAFIFSNMLIIFPMKAVRQMG